MYVSDASQTTNLQDSTSKGETSNLSKPKFPFNKYKNTDSKADVSETSAKDEYIKTLQTNFSLLNNHTATQSAAYSIANAQQNARLDNTDSSKNSFINNLIQNGYSQDEAGQRADIYQSSGLLTNLSSLWSVLDIEGSDFASTTLNPTYQKALRDAFDQMDTEQLKKVTSDLTSRFSIDMEELKKKIPKNLQVSDYLLKGFDDYEGYQFGSSGKLFDMLGKMMDQADMTERLTGVDQTELKDGINKVIDAYKRTLTI